MKTSYIFLASVLALTLASCNSDEPNDACDKHEYTEGEAPYLRSNPSATNAMEMVFQMAKIDQPQYINLKDYASCFHKNLNMTVDETLAALANGDVVFYPINSARQVWNIMEPNFGEYVWGYTSAGPVRTYLGEYVDPISPDFFMSLDTEKKRIEIKAVGTPAIGTMVNMDFGFAEKKNSAFDDYVRFSVTISVTDPSKIVLSANIPGEGYGIYSIKLKDFDENFQLAMGMTAAEVIEALEKDKIDVYLCDADGNRITNDKGGRPDYTSGAYGYWINPDMQICGWDGGGYPANLMFLEYGGDGLYNLGNADAKGLTPTGTQVKLTFEFVSVDKPENFIQFIVAVTFD